VHGGAADGDKMYSHLYSTLCIVHSAFLIK